MLMRVADPDPTGLLGLRAAWAACLMAMAAFAAALISQYFFGARPCPLCIWQRYPYVIGLILALPALLAPMAPRRALLGLAGIVFLVGAGIAAFHSGVEFGWWKGFESCSAPDTSAGLSAADFLNQLKQTDIVRCDDREPFFLGLSMANWNVLVSADIGACLLFAAATVGRLRR